MISAEQVRATVADLLGAAVTTVEHVPGSVANQDFAVDLVDGARFVLKAGPSAEIAAEAWTCQRLTVLGVPVPEVVAVDLDPTRLGLPFLIMTFVEGTPSADGEVARDAGKWFRQVHAEELSGWGPLIVAADHPGPSHGRGRYQSCREAIAAVLSGLPALVSAGVLDKPLANAARDLVSVEEILSYQGPGVLLHNDLKPAHLFGVGNGRRRQLSAIIDWGDASVGDPAADLARLSMSGPTVTAAFLEGYGVRINTDLSERLARYRLLWNIGALSYEYRAGGDWFDAYRDRIRDEAAQLVR